MLFTFFCSLFGIYYICVPKVWGRTPLVKINTDICIWCTCKSVAPNGNIIFIIIYNPLPKHSALFNHLFLVILCSVNFKRNGKWYTRWGLMWLYNIRLFIFCASLKCTLCSCVIFLT